MGKLTETDFHEAYVTYGTTLLQELNSYRAYMRGKSRYSGEELDLLKEKWLGDKKTHLEKTVSLHQIHETIWPDKHKQEEKYYTYRKIACENCGKYFHSPRGHAKYCHGWCSYTMRRVVMLENYFKRLLKKCKTCNEAFMGRRSDMRYCSNKCRQKNYRLKESQAN